eukprot:Phypoly_transcript_24283.p1 GENE.Phypoly_transcript_24283~~Phypoly_transcript_24283.p1  ORF type:complete len:140 (+),score=13.64 Phypoly_transcript_24283:130-549(+)
MLISTVQRQVVDYNDTNAEGNNYMKVDAVVTYQVVPLQHNIVLQSLEIQQTSAVGGVINLQLINEGISASPDQGVSVSIFSSGNPDFSDSDNSLIAEIVLSSVQSGDVYVVASGWNFTTGYIWVQIAHSSIVVENRYYR